MTRGSESARRRPRPLTGVIGATGAMLFLTVAGCGDDGSSAGRVAADVAPYCELAAELDAMQTQPTTEQLERVVSVAPADIEADVAAFVEAVTTGEYGPGIEDAEARLMEWESANCGDTFGGEED